MLGSLGRNIRTFVWALVLGLAVWVAAVTAADPNEVRAYPNAVNIELVGQNPNLVITSDLPKNVQLTLLAPRSVWDQLTARPACAWSWICQGLPPASTGCHCRCKSTRGRSGWSRRARRLC